MKLFLASEAKNPGSLPTLTEFVGGFENKKIAYIPTAANGEGWGSWKNGGTWQLLQTLPAQVKVVQLEDFFLPTADAVAELKDQDIIWMGGGYPGYLMYWLHRTKIAPELPALLNKGAIYVGSSAGSMIASPTLDLAEWYIGEGEFGAHYLPGLNLVNFDIYPHYRDELDSAINQKYQGTAMYLIKDGEAIMVTDGQVELFGETRLLAKAG